MLIGGACNKIYLSTTIGERLGNAVKGADGDAAIVAHQHVGADLDDNAARGGDLFSRREFGPLGFGGSYGSTPRYSHLLYANLCTRSRKIGPDDAFSRNQNGLLDILPARARGRKVCRLSACDS